MSGKLFIISSPSGAGKTTLVNAVLGRLQNQFSIDRVITYTSRDLRSGEIDGQHYHFVSSEDFEGRLKDGFFLEWSGRYGSYYGTPRHIVDELDQGQSRILIIDRLGAERVVSIAKDPSPVLTNRVKSVWIYTSDVQELERRLIKRGEETKTQIRRRLELAKQELEKEKQIPLYDHKILNDDFAQAAQKLENLIMCDLKS